jgi:FkbM family methyltransferase
MFDISVGDTVIDVGANIGVFTVKASRLVGPNGRVISLEPASKSFTLLEANILRNDLSNVKSFRYAVSDSEREASLYVDNVSDRSSLFSDLGDSERNRRSIETIENVETVSLDTLVESLKFDRIDVIKIDVEGAELAVLRGAKRTIAKYFPSIVLEWHPWGGPLVEIQSFLSTSGYKVLESEHRSDRTMVYAIPDNSSGMDSRTPNQAA